MWILYPMRVQVNKMESDENMKPTLLQKISELRKEVLLKDWSDDKIFSINGKGGYQYLSADKVKKTLAPLFSKHGIELKIRFSELECRNAIGNMSQHWTIRLDVSLVDVDSGDMCTSTVYGEAGDSGDKGVSKAQTCAIKQWVFSEFFIADGIDPDAVGSMTDVGGFYKKSPEDREEVVSKVLAQSMKPTPKEEPKTEAVKTEVPKEEPKEAPKEEPKAVPEAKPAKKPKADAPASEEESPAPKAGGFKPTGPQAKAIARIEAVWEERAKAGQVSVEEYNAMSMARATMASAADAVAFIKTYKVG